MGVGMESIHISEEGEYISREDLNPKDLNDGTLMP